LLINHLIIWKGFILKNYREDFFQPNITRLKNPTFSYLIDGLRSGLRVNIRHFILKKLVANSLRAVTAEGQDLFADVVRIGLDLDNVGHDVNAMVNAMF
jgi:hypothetical protein